MLRTTYTVEEDIQHLLDLDYIEKELSFTEEDVFIVYVCVNDDWRKDDSWEDEGTHYHRIIFLITISNF